MPLQLEVVLKDNASKEEHPIGSKGPFPHQSPCGDTEQAAMLIPVGESVLVM